VATSLSIGNARKRAFGTIVLVALAAGILLLGWILGGRLVGGGPVARLASGAVIELHLQGGAVLIGQLVAEEGDYLRLRSPASLTAPAAGAEPDGGQWTVRMLGSDPFAVAGDVLVPSDQITFLGAVAAQSGIAAAYRQAAGGATLEPLPSATQIH
jgi:hypothetical protein